MIDLLSAHIKDLIIEPLSFAFMQRALLVALIVSITCGIFSCFLILKGWSLMGDALSHAILPGLVFAAMFGAPLLPGAIIAALICASLIGLIKQNSRIKEDAAMGIIFSGMFALGLVMITHVETDLHLMHILFGDILGVHEKDFWTLSIISSLTVLILLIKRKDFMLYCFDTAQCRIAGLSEKTLHYMLLILLSTTIVAALKTAGIILVIAMLIAPGATAFLLTASFGRMMMIACAVSIISSITGLLLSFHFDIATAPLIVATQASFFAMAYIKAILQNKIPLGKKGGKAHEPQT